MPAPDHLNDPLGQKPLKPRRVFPMRPVLLSGAGLLLIGGGAFLQWHGDPMGGEPHVVTAITPAKTIASAQPAAPKARAAATSEATSTTTLPAGDALASEIEQKSGVKVVRNGGAEAPGSVIIDVPKVLAQRLAPAPDPRLVEKRRYGLLPRVDSDGARPSDVYARPAPAAKPPRIALIVGGVGLSDQATAAAINSLPGPVTLAFAPYGKDLKAKVQQARDAGHEVILQLPMEPIDYPQANPGPHTLLASATAAENTDNLHWLLSRFTGYTGVANFLGGKFTSDAKVLKPLLREIGQRGLFYIDDGSSARSIGLATAAEVGLPAVSADLILDAQGGDLMDANFTKLETLARSQGTAIGMMSDLPGSVQNLARYAQAAKAQGITLIPLSAAVRLETQARDASNQAGPGRTTRVFRAQ